jgi:hypothetical protein
LTELDYFVGSNGRANVWIRKNIKETTEEIGIGENDGHNKMTVYVADEIEFTVDPELIERSEIENDIDFFFEEMKDQDYQSADYLALETIRAKTRAEISAACGEAITRGFDIEIGGKTQHFSLTETDQLNLFGKQMQLVSGADQLEYHEDGHPCEYYSAADMANIIETAMAHVTYHTTYCNSLFQWINGCEKASEFAEISYGVEIPVEYQSEVYKDIIGE